jgi:SAM-dependent methyltransferase
MGSNITHPSTTAKLQYFGQQAQKYSHHRPDYPPEIFAFLASISPSKEKAVDCATGNGQAARGLAQYFSEVIATDINEAQIALARPEERIRYLKAPAEKMPVAANSVDLLTVACGVHWFDLDRFYPEVERVLKPDGVIAVWTYSWPLTGSALVDEVLDYLKEYTLAKYWPTEARLYLNRYEDLRFPFAEIVTPQFQIECNWNALDFLGFISTWAVVQRYERETKEDFFLQTKSLLEHAWSFDPPSMPLRLPLYCRVGKKLD